MKNLINFLSIIGLVSISHLAFAIDNAADGDKLTADMWNKIVDAVNTNSSKGGLDFDITQPPCGGGTVYKVGDMGVDGLIFFVTADGCNGLEAASIDSGPTGKWGCIGTDVPGADGLTIGDGALNTVDIINAGCTDGTTDAADLARAYAGGGMTDWYLASPDELKEMYKTIGLGPGDANPGGLAEAHWSSAESNDTHAFGVQMNRNGGHIINEFIIPLGTPKGFLYRVRPIRTLNP